MLRKKKQTPQEQSDQEFNLALEVPAEQRPKGWRPFVRRNWKRIAAAACAAAVAGALLLPGKGAKPAGVDTEYLESAVERRNITNVFSGSGTIAAANTYTVNALVSGTVLTADFAVGDTIEEGTVLYTIDSSNASNSVEKAQLSLDQAQRNYEDAVDAQYVRSTIGGTLASYKVAVGDVVTAGQEVATVRDASTLLLTLEFPAADAANFTVGQAAQVTLDGTFEAVSGTVRSVSGADALSSGNLLVRTVTIAVNNTGSLTTAQAATASVNGVSALASAKFSYQNEQTITASTGGTVTALCVKEGSSVSADTALVRISGKELTKQVQNASDNLRSAQMSMEDTEDQLNNYTITSPISGTVISKEVKAGRHREQYRRQHQPVHHLRPELPADDGECGRAGDPLHQGGAERDHHRGCHLWPHLYRRGHQRVQGGHHGRRHHHLSRHHPHRRYRRPAARHERHRRDHDGQCRERTFHPQCRCGAGQLCAGDQGFPQRCQRRPQHDRPGGLCLCQGDHRHQR